MKPAWAVPLLMILLSACASTAKRTPSAISDPPATHGMLLFGDEKIYVSHLPMFHRPHDYQGIFQLEIGPSGLAAYKNSRRDFPQETVYTLVPRPFSLPQMAENPTPFRAHIYRGHFERGGALIASDVPVNIREVVYFQKFDPSASRPPIPTYILFGNEREQFAAHLISAAPDFDQIVQLDAPEVARFLSRGSFHLGALRNLSADKPLAPQQGLRFSVSDEEGAIPTSVVKSFYVEFGDLAR